MPASGGTPLARLHNTATQLGIIVVDAADDDGPLLDDDTAAFIACGVCIALNPGLDDGLRADVLAMALALTHALSPGTADHGGDITAAGGFALISRTRENAPVSALGLLATVIAHEHGHATASAAFKYTVMDSDLALMCGRLKVAASYGAANEDPLPAIQAVTRRSSMSRGTEPPSSTASWNSLTSKSSASSCSARVRSSRIFSWPTLYASACPGFPRYRSISFTTSSSWRGEFSMK
jgi:hypothetical protein